MKIALAGNPNSGKTTLFNVLTGKTESVGNWSGVTVAAKQALLKKKYTPNNAEIQIVDLPGSYSISPYTSEEAITRDYILRQSPDVIINIVDGANLSRSLFFTTQLIELGIPVVIALNKIDVLGKRKDFIDVSALSEELGCPVVPVSATLMNGIDELIQEAIKSSKDKKTATIVQESFPSDKARQQYVNKMTAKCFIKKREANKLTFSDKIDRLVANQWLGLPLFFLVMWAIFAFSIEGLGGFLSEYLNEVFFGELVPDAAHSFFEGLGVHPLLQAIIVEGAIGGVGAVIGFLPLIMVLFFCLSLLEDSGYMARVALLMNRYFKKIGLSGKSIIPMIVGSGCAIPGVMATRTIEDINEKRMTTILTPFVPCGAKLPIIALFTAVFFPHHTWVGPSIYIVSLIMIIIGGLLLKKMFVWENTSDFILELPEYKLPSLKYAFLQMLDKAKAFIYKAATIILVCNTIVWFASAYDWKMQPVVDQSQSILASVAGVIALILIPLGFVGWQLAAASITGFIAKENVVATLAVILAVASDDALHMPGGVLTEFFTPVTGLAFLLFNLFTPPCFAAIGAMNAEFDSKKWLFRALGFQFAVGYTLAMLVSQIGSLIIYGAPTTGFVPAIIITALLTMAVIFIIKKADFKRAQLGVEI